MAGNLHFNPLKDKLVNDSGQEVFLEEPKGVELPSRGFDVEDPGYLPPPKNSEEIQIRIKVILKDCSCLLHSLPGMGKTYQE